MTSNITSPIKSAVVFGVTGITGQAVLNELLRNSRVEKVTAVTRKSLYLENSKFHEVLLSDFSILKEYEEQLHADVYFCCIGTTIKKAGNKVQFRSVDYKIPVAIAKLAEQLSVSQLFVVSSIGSNPKSSNFYLRTKGEMERDVRKNYSGNLRIVRPSLLIGTRDEIRIKERFAIILMKLVGWMFVGTFRKYKSIRTTTLAKAMMSVAFSAYEKSIYESDELHAIGKRAMAYRKKEYN